MTYTDGQEKYIWFAADGREQLFRLSNDPRECHDLAKEPQEEACLTRWRERLLQHLQERPEGFSDGKQLIPGQLYARTLQK